MTNKKASEVLHRFHKCKTVGDYLCAASTCRGCEKYDSDIARNEALLMGAKALENTITGWLLKVLENLKEYAEKLTEKKKGEIK